MKKILTIILCFMPLISVAKATEKQDYKCHVSTSSEDRVIFFNWTASEVDKKMARLTGRKMKDYQKNRKYFIREVNECLPLNATFSTSLGREIDNKTLR
ncbi:TapY2 family type IVa secretion system protein [uncultured Shewanella sp.]|uniref:TapY2 family type IVa secretion system protein n=1 Tax=uncultured Shewanella sp. TaxID=173975 RepID=UPI00261F764F|nr:TapY2 family type IVa secretion system protein [uncultured Shewanella sp.]